MLLVLEFLICGLPFLEAQPLPPAWGSTSPILKDGSVSLEKIESSLSQLVNILGKISNSLEEKQNSSYSRPEQERMIKFIDCYPNTYNLVTNLALNRPTWASSHYIIGSESKNAVDGLRGQVHPFHTHTSDKYLWWSVDLGLPSKVFNIYITMRGNLLDRAMHYKIYLSNSPIPSFDATFDEKTLWGAFPGPPISAQFTIYPKPNQTITGRYLTIHKTTPGILEFFEVEVYGIQMI